MMMTTTACTKCSSINMIFMPPQAMHRRGCSVFTMSSCPDVPCQHGLVRMAGESITHSGDSGRHHMIAHGLKVSSFKVSLLLLL